MIFSRLLSARWLVSIPVLLILAVGLACGDDDDPTVAPDDDPTVAPTEVVVVPTGEPAFLDAAKLSVEGGDGSPRYGGILLNGVIQNLPHHDLQQGTGSTFEVLIQLHNNLIMTHPYDNQVVVQDLAHSWDLSADATSITFHLREGVKWHDGTPFTSADPKATFDRVLFNGKVFGSEEEGAFLNGSSIQAFFKSFEAPDDLTFIAILQGPTPAAAIKILADGVNVVEPKHIIEKDPINALKDDPMPIGTGPFRLTEEPSDLLWKYERNPDYFKPGLPYLDGIESHVILDVQARATAVLTQKLHWNNPSSYSAILPAMATDLAGQDSGLRHITVPTTLWDFFVMNMKRPPFDDIRVRQAFSEAIDRDAFLLVGGLGNQNGRAGLAIWPESPWAVPKAMRETFIGYGPDMEVRRENARKLLAEYEAEKGTIDWSKVPYQIPTQHVGGENGEIIQSLMKKVGVDLVLKPVEQVSAWGNQVDGNFNMSGMIGATDFDDPTEALAKVYVTGASFGFHAVGDPEIDRLFEEQKFEQDTEKRKKIVWEIERLGAEQAGTLFLVWKNTERLQRDFVKGWTPSEFWSSTAARSEYVWFNLPELPFSR